MASFSLHVLKVIHFAAISSPPNSHPAGVPTGAVSRGAAAPGVPAGPLPTRHDLRTSQLAAGPLRRHLPARRQVLKLYGGRHAETR